MSTSTPRNSSPDTVVVGRIGRPHGVRGEVTVEVRTDDPDLRFVPGAVLRTDPAERGPITITGVHWHSGTLLLRLEGPGGPIESREAAEAVRNTELLVDVADLPPQVSDGPERLQHLLKPIELRMGVEIANRGNVFRVSGDDAGAVARTERLLRELYEQAGESTYDGHAINLRLNVVLGY